MNTDSRDNNVDGYEIQRSYVFENNMGFALAENKEARPPFVTWQFKENGDGTKTCRLGHYYADKNAAEDDYALRVVRYRAFYGLSEKNSHACRPAQRSIGLATPENKENVAERQGHMAGKARERIR